MNDAEVRLSIREQITEGKSQGKDVTHLQIRLIEIDKKLRKNKNPRINTP